MNTFTLTTRHQLSEHRPMIEALFYRCFGKRELGDVWEWAYINNPNGEPIVSLCYQDQELVGHYAIVPMPLCNGVERKNTYISMTTMVAESHRKFGLFTQLAQLTYEVAGQLGVDHVFGFPNSQSAPGFRKRLNWSLPVIDYVATVSKPALMHAVATGEFSKSSLFGLDLKNKSIREWRLSRPGATYIFEQGVAYKPRQGEIDLLWWESSEALTTLPNNAKINLIIKADSSIPFVKRFEYQFGGIGLRSSFNADSISRELALSDLF